MSTIKLLKNIIYKLEKYTQVLRKYIENQCHTIKYTWYINAPLYHKGDHYSRKKAL